MFSFLSSAAFAETFILEYSSGNMVTISKGPDFNAVDIKYTYCGALNFVTLSISENNSPTTSSGKTILATVMGDSSGVCDKAIASLLPITYEYGNKVKNICVSGGTLLDKFKSGHCVYGSDITSSVDEATCTISSGDISHEYGTIFSDEVDGMSITTVGSLTCSGGSSGSTTASLKLKDSSISLNNDGSLSAILSLDGENDSINYNIDVNSTTTFSLTSTLHSNGKVTSGTFSGSSILTLSYY